MAAWIGVYPLQLTRRQLNLFHFRELFCSICLIDDDPDFKWKGVFTQVPTHPRLKLVLKVKSGSFGSPSTGRCLTQEGSQFLIIRYKRGN